MQSNRQQTALAIQSLRGNLIVSSQASDGEPLCAPEHIFAMAQSALNGGARALRLEGADNIEFARKRTDVCIIGLTKCDTTPEAERLSSVYITPTFDDADKLAAAGADIIAMDCTLRPRPGGWTVNEIVDRIHLELRKPVWADVATFDEAMAAEMAGVDIISTTLSGYTKETFDAEKTGPDFALLERMVKSLKIPVVLEGKVWYPEDVRRGFELGAYAVVVGSAITRPQLITERFVKAIPKVG